MTSGERFRIDFAAAGGNRHPSAADWAPGLLAFGAGNNVALWNPKDGSEHGVSALLTGHTDSVNAVRIFDTASNRLLVTGSSDHSLRVWVPYQESAFRFRQTNCLTEHHSSVNSISNLNATTCFVSGAADGSIKVWKISDSSTPEITLTQSITLTPRYIPLTTAVVSLPDGQTILAVGGTNYSIQIFCRASDDQPFQLQATLTGHEGWIRSLDFKHEVEGVHSEIILASASQDKYIRLWRFSRDSALSNGHAPEAVQTGSVKKSLSNKAHWVGLTMFKYTITFEALLVGHEDWIYTAKWAPRITQTDPLRLLSASADNSLAIWIADVASGVWISTTRLGEISAQKGSTTATGSAGGFWIGLWRPDATEVVSLGRTGSWRRWRQDEGDRAWLQCIGTTGHVGEVRSLAWSPDGCYLLSVGSDQTTRLFAEWRRARGISWHEISRPQIHGYDLNCVDSLGANQFISGADEKLLRVFNKPRTIEQLLNRVGDRQSLPNASLPDAANIPVLGLSNKAIAAVEDDDYQPMHGTQDPDRFDRDAVDPASVVKKSTLDIHQPPFEDHLARHTLWPEHEKLYGHGYEISAVAASTHGHVVATACKASSIDHAVIRLYETQDWREIKPPLASHNLTVTSLAFSHDDRYLVSVGRDRQWTLFERAAEDSKEYRLVTSNPKGHSRMILDCTWAPAEAGYVFATAGRDKVVKLWRINGNSTVEGTSSIADGSAVTAVSIDQVLDGEGHMDLAFGTEDGRISVVRVSTADLQVQQTMQVSGDCCPSKAVTKLAWRPRDTGSSNGGSGQVAVASEDASVRICSLLSRG